MKGEQNSSKLVSRWNDEPNDHPTTFSARETMDMKKMIEQVLQQNKLLPVSEE